MMMTTHERPGVYSSYEASSLTAAASRGAAVAVIAPADQAEEGRVYLWTSYSQAVADVGDCELSQMAQLAIRNGAGQVYGIAAGQDYEEALETAAQVEDAAVMVCGSTELSVQKALKNTVEECSAARRERIAVVGGKAGESVEQLVARAKELNSERIILAAPGSVDGSGTAVGGALCAAALAGAIAGNADPALPMGGAQLYGLSGLETAYRDGDIDALVRGGVTPLETLAGACFVVRGVTTRTSSGGVPDATWRDLTTILVVDEVVPGIRNALRAKFSRSKNTAQTRGAIRSQTVLELEKRVNAEIIDRYEDVTVSPSEDDPAICLVEFAFTVAHGLNQIWLSAHITV